MCNSDSAVHRVLAIAAAAALPLLAACAAAYETPPLAMAAAHASASPAPAGEPTLEQVRAATERFRDVRVALAEGYVQDPTGMCVTAEMEGHSASAGAMGIHFFRPDLLGITGVEPRVDGTGTHTDFLRPAVLVYEPQADGSLELVAVENLVFAQSWYAAGHAAPPVFHGVPWDRMEDDPATEVDEAHGFATHYDRHVWIYRENPAGVFAPFNANVTCEHHRHAAHH
jgi:hypothetical protein